MQKYSVAKAEPLDQQYSAGVRHFYEGSEVDAEIAKLKEALRYYADPKRWQEFRITEGDIFGARHGDFGFAFNADSDNPWSVASLVL